MAARKRTVPQWLKDVTEAHSSTATPQNYTETGSKKKVKRAKASDSKEDEAYIMTPEDLVEIAKMIVAEREKKS